MFLINYIHLEVIWSDFMKIDFFRFFDPQKNFFTYICGRNSDFPAEIGQKMFGIHFLTSKPFSKKMPPNGSDYFPTYTKKCDHCTFPRKCTFWKSVVFVAFVAFWGTTMLFFKKFKVRAFRKVYGLWFNFQPLKSYITLNF